MSVTILTTAQLAHAIWVPGKTAQINFYTDIGCTQDNDEVAAWLDQSPEAMGDSANCGITSSYCTMFH
ncbi:hypothetical protein B0H19DRAFT_1270438 [Mycena capillaripes]|nr:hypothetical protein B0H19DRAFT_1270438 [Mycena capillaripes]